jgi:hypothetical protein
MGATVLSDKTENGLRTIKLRANDPTALGQFQERLVSV